jgi:hypothetical protein
VRRADVGDDADVRARDVGQHGDLAAPAHRHLQHPRRFVTRRRQDGQRQADVGVVVAGRLPHRAQRPQRRRAHLPGGGLAVRSRDTDDAALELGAHRARQIAERAPRIVDREHRHVVAARRHAARRGDHDARGAGGRGLAREVEPVGALARQREEQLAGGDRSAVVGRARKRRAALARVHDRRAHRARREFEAARGRCRRRRRRAHRGTASAAAASSRSSKCTFVVPRIW